MNVLEEIFEKSQVEPEYYRDYCQYVSKLLAEIDVNAVQAVTQVFLEARDKDKTIYFAGNGGSAATASHFAQDLSEVSRKTQTKGFRTQSVTDNVAAITALGNDYGYDDIFSLQLQYRFNPGDVLVVISASGNSQNIINAVELAKEKGGTTVGLVGFDGGKLAEICDHVIHIESNKGEYGPVEDLHLILDHMIVSYLTLQLKESNNS